MAVKLERKTYGALTVVTPTQAKMIEGKGLRNFYQCRCSCGKEVERSGEYILSHAHQGCLCTPDLPVEVPPKTACKQVTFKGKTQSISAWSRDTGISAALITMRIKRGWSISDALTLDPSPHPGRSGHPSRSK